MKSVTVILFAFVAVSVRAISDDQKEMIKNLAADCKEETKASDADIDAMIDKQLPSTPEGKCLGVCMQKQFGIIKEGKFSTEGFLELTKMIVENDEEKLKKAELIAGDCEAITDPNECEMGYKLTECMQNSAKTRNIDLGGL